MPVRLRRLRAGVAHPERRCLGDEGPRHVRFYGRVSRRAGAAPHARRLAAHNPPLPLRYLYRYVLMLCEDGSHGLDLSFVTHLFLINEVSDPAKRQQVVSRAHRMGATGPVVVEPVRMWDD